MSHAAPHGAAPHAQVHVLPDHHEAGHGSMRGYVIGFVLSVILTAIPFWMVMADAFADKRITIAFVLGLGVVQIVVHMIFFLHLNTRSEGGWTMLALIFTVVLVVITLSGSIWIMYHLDQNMMPVSSDTMRNMP